jgi:DNA-binding transcriptional LysR family regulator
MLGFDDARVILSIHRSGTLSAAARALSVDQSTVSRRLAALEASLGTALFERSSDGYRATPAVQRVLLRLERLEEELDGLQRELAGKETRLAGRVRLTAPDAFGARFLAPALASFRRRHPEIEVELHVTNRALNLYKREADVALRLQRPVESALVARKAAELGTGLYAARSYIEEHGRPRANRRGLDMRGLDLIGYGEAFQPEEEVRWLERHGRGARIALRTNSAQAQLEAAAAGIGLAILPAYLAEGRPELVRLLAPSRVLVRSMWIVVTRELRGVARVRALRDFLVEVLAANATRLRGP